MYLNLNSSVYTGALMEQSHKEGARWRCGEVAAVVTILVRGAEEGGGKHQRQYRKHPGT
jgi:hypothetical protein